MRAIILAAGVGRRLGDSVTEQPKCLLAIGERTLLDRTLDALEVCGVLDTVIVVGHLASQIEAAVDSRMSASASSMRPPSTIRTILNPDYRRGAILSLHTAREFLDRSVLIMDADVLFPVELLGRLIVSPHANCFLMDRSARDDGEAQLLMCRAGRVVDIARRLRGDYDEFGESIGFLKLDARAAAVLRVLLERAVSQGQDAIEHEELYPALMREVIIGAEPAEDLPWLEIDFPEDVERARAMERAVKGC